MPLSMALPAQVDPSHGRTVGEGEVYIFFILWSRELSTRVYYMIRLGRMCIQCTRYRVVDYSFAAKSSRTAFETIVTLVTPTSFTFFSCSHLISETPFASVVLLPVCLRGSRTKETLHLFAARCCALDLKLRLLLSSLLASHTTLNIHTPYISLPRGRKYCNNHDN